MGRAPHLDARAEAQRLRDVRRGDHLGSRQVGNSSTNLAKVEIFTV